MLRYWACLLVLGLILSNSKGHAKTLQACGHPFYPPVSWVEQQQLTGFAVAVTEQLFEQLGYQVRFHADSNWKRCLLEVKHGRVDIVIAAYKVPSRKSYLAFSSEYLIADKVRLFVNSNHTFEVSQLTDLEHKVAGLLLGDSFGDAFDHFIEQNLYVEYVSQGTQNFAKLAKQRVDYIPLGQLSGQIQLKKAGLDSVIQTLPFEVVTEHYYLALSKQSTVIKHLPQLNQTLKQWHQSGKIKQLIEYYSQQYLNKTGVP